MKTNVLTKFFSISMTIMTLTAMENNNQVDYLKLLPREVKEKIFSLLEPRDFDALACSSKKNCRFLNAHAADMVTKFFPSTEFNKKLSEYNEYFDNKKILLPYNLLNFPRYWLASYLDESFQTFQGLSPFKDKILSWAKSIKPIERNGLEALKEKLSEQSLSSKLIIKNISNISDFIILFNNHPRITSLDLTKNRIGCEGTQLLVEDLKKNNTLRSLNLTNNKIRDEGTRALSELLERNNCITSINLEENDIRCNAIELLAQSLTNNNSIRYINLSRNKLDCQEVKNDIRRDVEYRVDLIYNGQDCKDVESRILDRKGRECTRRECKGIEFLVKSLKINKSITFIDLSFNGIIDKNAIALGEALETNKSITYINLSRNRFFHNGAKAICEGLKKNESITSINLSHNCIMDEGAKAFCEVLKTNESITSINLSDTYITDEGAKVLAEVFKASKSIRFITMITGIKYLGIKALTEAFNENKAIKLMDIDFKKLSR